MQQPELSLQQDWPSPQAGGSIPAGQVIESGVQVTLHCPCNESNTADCPLPPAKVGFSPPAAAHASAQALELAMPLKERNPAPRVQKQQVVGEEQTHTQLSASYSWPAEQATWQVSSRAQEFGVAPWHPGGSVVVVVAGGRVVDGQGPAVSPGWRCFPFFFFVTESV